VLGDEEDGNRDLISYLRILWRHKWIVVLAAAIGVAGTLGVDSQRTRIYEGTATILFVSQTYAAPGEVSPLSPSDVVTDIALIQGSSVHQGAIKTLRRPAPKPTVAQVGTTDTATVTVSSTDSAFAARAANAYANAYITVSQNQYVSAQQGVETQLQNQINAVQGQVFTVENQISLATSPSSITTLNASLGNLEGELQTLRNQLTQVQVDVAQTPSGGRMVTPATVDRAPVSPKPVTDSLLFGVVGLLLGVALALLLERIDDRIRNKEDLERVSTGLPTLGLIPNVEDWRDEHSTFLVAAQRPKSPPAEAYRGLRTSIQFLGFDQTVKTLQITSPVAAEGKTTTAANLAVTMALTGQRVVLVSLDLRRPRIHEFFGLSNDVGFTSVMVGDANLEDALLPVAGYESLYLLPSGPIPPNPSELLGGTRAAEILRALSENSDLVLIDSPPAMPITDASVLAAHVDGVLLVVVAGSTTRKDIRRSLETLGRVGAKVVGVVLNKASEGDSYGYYRYGYAPKSEESLPVASSPTEVAHNGHQEFPIPSYAPSPRSTRRRSD
jgi:non-specific protein-tyrosine kinase